MSSVVLQAETLNLPEVFALKLRGKKVELLEKGDTITISPVKNPIETMHGMFKSDGHAVGRHLSRKRLEKELEYGN